MLIVARRFTPIIIALLFSACTSTPAPIQEESREPTEVEAEEELLNTTFGPMTESELTAAAERGDTSNAREHLAQFEQEIEGLRSAADEVPRLGEGNIEETTQRLDRLTDIDQFVRQLFVFFVSPDLTQDETIFLHQTAGKVWHVVDEENTAELRAFVQHHGWPRISEYGEAATQNAWLLAQHADQNVEFQKTVLKELAALLEEEETNPRNYAYLYDRVAMNTDELQRYGTQGICTGPGQWEPLEMEDPEEVDARRQTRGLESMEDYKTRFVDMCH